MANRAQSASGGLLVGAAILVATGIASAGDLNPPAGPIAPTPGPEPRTAINIDNTPGDADSLYRIEKPGAYYLTQNEKGEPGKHGIEIAASGVTIDLMGFELTGVAGSLNGVTVSGASLTNIEVRSGSTREWGQDGIDLSGGGTNNCRIIDVRASANGVYGISAGSGSVVTGCVSTDNASGFILGGYTVAENCTANANSSIGIYAPFSCTIDGCIARQNGDRGIEAGANSVLRGCTAALNTSDGIRVGGGSTVIGCAAATNTSSGIVAVGGGNVVIDCASINNQGDGIEVQNGCIIRGNQCRNNGFGSGDGAGIVVTSSDNRIENNNCASNDRGIDVDSLGNIIVGNTCSGNTTDWDIVANNIYGPIIDRRAPASAAVSGFSAPSTLGSTDPNANYSY